MVLRRISAVVAGIVLAGLWAGQALAADSAPAPAAAPAAPAAAPVPASQPASASASAPASAPAERPGPWEPGKLDFRTREDLSLPWAQMAASILILLVLGAAGLVVTRKVLPRLRPAAGRSVRVLETTYVASRQALHLVEVGGRRYLIAGNKDGLSLLSEVGGSFEEHVQQRLKQGEQEGASA